MAGAVPSPAASRLVSSSRLVGARMGKFLSNRCRFVRDSLLVIRDDCRFPHILEPQNQHMPAQNSGRGGHRGPRGHISGPSLEQKFGAMSVRDVSVCFLLTPDKKSYDLIQDGAQPRGPNGIERSISADSGRPRFQGLKTNQSIANTKKGPRQLQRVPNADEFPVLAGSVTPPSRSPGANGTLHINGFNGPTAAQVLQAPAPVRQNSTRESSTRGTSPDSAKAAKIQVNN